MDSEFPSFILFILAIIFIRVIIIPGLDKSRVEEYIKREGGTLLSMEWEPFGPGWFWSRALIYKVFYLDKDDNKHEAFLKTDFLIGVYFIEDKIIETGNKYQVDDDVCL